MRLSLEQAEGQAASLQRALQDADARVDEAVRNKDQEIER